MTATKVSPQTAARLSGKSKTTILRAMNDGRLSYEIDESGNRHIERSELERVFGPLDEVARAKTRASAPATAATVEAELKRAADMLETERMKMRIKMLEDQLYMSREQVEDLKQQRDEWQKQAQQTLVTSQYSQKQADELKAELRERDRREAERKAALEERMRRLKQQSQNQNQNRQGASTDEQQTSEPKSFWDRIRNRTAA